MAIITLLILFLFLSPPLNITIISLGLVSATRPLTASSSSSSSSSWAPFKNEYEPLGPRAPGGGPSPARPGGFTNKELDACKPKGFRRNSAPSHYVNYHTLGVSTLCSTDKN